MESYNYGIVPHKALQKPPNRRNRTSLGLVSTLSFPVIVSTADAMLKASGVTLVGFEKIGSGHCTAIVRGVTAEVRIAVQTGVEHAKREGQLLSSLVIPRPFPNLDAVLPLGSHLVEEVQQPHHSRHSSQALGLLETRGFPAIVGAADAMLKAANVELTGYETIGAGLCTVIIRGRVAEVAMALQVGMEQAQQIGELVAVTVITRPLEDLERALPTASYLIEEQPQPLKLPIDVKAPEKEPQPLQLPMEVKEPEREPIELPDLEKL